MKVYLSARYAKMEDLRVCRDDLKAAGIQCTSRWLDGGTFEVTAENAQLDVDDVLAAGWLVNFTEEPVEFSPHPFASRGGRHVELGIALGCGHGVVIVGPRENVFHHLPGVYQFDDWAHALAFLELQR